MRLAELAQKINPVQKKSQLTGLALVVKQAYYGARARMWHSRDLPKDVFVFLLICLMGIGALTLGRILVMETERKAELRIIKADTSMWGGGVVAVSRSDTKTDPPSEIHGMYIGSRNGTAYYLPWCGGVKLIHEENKVWFGSKEEAAAKGYKPAGNCKGI